jgi:hypothetical protein
MAAPRSRAPRAIPLIHQRLALARRYPESEVILTRHELVWSGRLSPAEYSHSYEVVISHNLHLAPLVYVVRPRLEVVTGKHLPHVFALNTLCLHTLSRPWIASRLIADTLVPWASEWLFFYELWLATGGEWFGEGVHSATDSRDPRKPNREKPEELRQQRLLRLTEALRVVYDPKTHAELDELLFNTAA